MPYKKVHDHPKCPASKPVGLVLSETGELLGCHESEESAQKQIAKIEMEKEQHMSGDVFFTRAFFDTGNKVRAEDLLKDETLPVPFIASTEGVKSDGQDLRMDDWLLSRYEEYGPIIWAHDYGHPPLGLGMARKDDKLRIDVRFDEDDPFAMMIRRKAIKGMMAGSVGWRTLKGGRNELIEFSMAPVPIDPDALPEIQRMGYRAMQVELAEALGDANEDEGIMAVIETVRKSVLDEIKDFLAQMVAADEADETDEDDQRELDEEEVDTETTAEEEDLDEERADEEEVDEEEVDEEEEDEEPDGRGENLDDVLARAGAALSQRNREDLEQALILIQGVISRATPAAESDREDPFRAEPDEAGNNVDQRGEGSEPGDEPEMDPDLVDQIKKVLNKE